MNDPSSRPICFRSISVASLPNIGDQHGDVVAAIEAGYGRLLVGSWFGLTAIGRYGLSAGRALSKWPIEVH